MKNTIIVIGVCVVLGVLLFGGFFLLQRQSPQTQQPADNSGGTTDITVPNHTQAGATPSTNTLSVATIDGGTVLVKDFISNKSATPDPSNKGHYYLAGMFSVSNQRPPYSIVYNESDQSFTISLWNTPLAATRIAAEQELKKQLNISNPFLCALRYWVGTSNEVDKTYGATNLGLSFCPGATLLP